METIFVNAENGGILINEGPGNPGEFAKTPATVAQLIKKFDIINRGAAFCSSMDFANCCSASSTGIPLKSFSFQNIGESFKDINLAAPVTTEYIFHSFS